MAFLLAGRPPLLVGNGKGMALRFPAGTCGVLGDSCGHPELPRSDADEALEVMAELALVREADTRCDLCQGQVAVSSNRQRNDHEAGGVIVHCST